MSLLFIAPRNYVIPIVTPEAGFDPFWGNTVLLMHMDGINNGTVFLEEKGKTITKGGTVVTSTTNPKFGSTSSAFNNGALSAPASTDFLFTGDFTIEGWIRFNAITGGVQCLYGQKNATNYYFYIGWYGANGQWICALNGQSNLSFNNAAPVAGQWYHVAFVRSNGAVKLYVDGVGSNSIANSSTLGYSDAAAYVGCTYPSQNILVGNIDDIRVTKDVARYTANFDVPTAAFPDARGIDYYWDNTVLAMNCDDLTDLRGKTVTNYGMVVDAAKKVTGDGSLSKSSSTYARLPWSSEFSFEADFTIEAWVYPTRTDVPNDDGWGRQAIFSIGKLYNSGVILLEWTGYAAASKFSFRWMSSDVSTQVGVTSASTYALNTWHHVAISRKGTNIYLFVNGQQAATVVSSTLFVTTGGTPTVNIGRADYGATTRDFVGNIDGLRVTKGIARYTSPFLPSQDSFALPLVDPYWSYTSLAMRMNGADNGTTFTDEKGKAVTRVGNVVTKTSVKKFGTASGFLEGTGAYISLANSEDYKFGTGDFTFEAWLYPTQFTGAYARRIAAFGRNNVASNMSLVITNTGIPRIDIGSSSILSSSSALSLNAWSHLVVEKISGVLKIFINGVQTGTVSNATSLTFTQTLLIGYDDTVGSGSEFMGYVDDLRITKGIARYSSNFVAPTRELLLGS